jgi:hypothetical protein
MQLEGLRKVERTRARWRDEEGKDARFLGIRSCWVAVMNRREWKEGLKEVETPKSCRANDDDDDDDDVVTFKRRIIKKKEYT